MSARRHLAALERAGKALGVRGCPACRHRHRLIAVREGRDLVPHCPPCGTCGGVPETVIVEVVVNTREEARAALERVREAGEAVA